MKITKNQNKTQKQNKKNVKKEERWLKNLKKEVGSKFCL